MAHLTAINILPLYRIRAVLHVLLAFLCLLTDNPCLLTKKIFEGHEGIEIIKSLYIRVQVMLHNDSSEGFPSVGYHRAKCGGCFITVCSCELARDVPPHKHVLLIIAVKRIAHECFTLSSRLVPKIMRVYSLVLIGSEIFCSALSFCSRRGPSYLSKSCSSRCSRLRNSSIIFEDRDGHVGCCSISETSASMTCDQTL